MRHTRASVIKRTIKEFQLLDKQVARLKPANWNRSLPRYLEDFAGALAVSIGK